MATATLPKGQLTKSFNIIEFHSKDGHPVPERFYCNVTKVAQNLQVLRDEIGEPVWISGSGYRTPTHNKLVGGAPNSQHLTASAADISTKNKTPKQLAGIIERLIKEGKMTQGGIGVYAGFVHYDIRGTAARW